jgi:hypothetical protein
MAIAALITYLITAVAGFILLGTWVAKGGHRREGGTSSRFHPGLVFGHFLLAVAGLVLWIAYLAVDTIELAWAAVAVLVVVALLGFTMFARWLPQVRDAHAAATAERRFPVVVVLGHGLLAATTLVLALLAAATA